MAQRHHCETKIIRQNGVLFFCFICVFLFVDDFKTSSLESKKYKYGLEEYSTEIELTKAAKANGQVIEKANKDDIKIYYKK